MAQPIAPWVTVASGAAASHSLREPHSSASMWLNAIQRSRRTSSTRATAWETAGKSDRWPQWKSSGWSASTRNWLNVSPLGPTAGRKVESR